MSFWFDEKFSWQQSSLPDTDEGRGVCTVLVAAWLKLKQSDTTGAGALSMLNSMGGGWGSIKKGVIDGGITGNDWSNFAVEQFGPLSFKDMSTIYLCADDLNALSQLFHPVAVQASLYRYNFIFLGGRHALGVFRDDCIFHKYHMFDPNFGEYRATSRTGVQKWLASLYELKPKYKELREINMKSWS